MKFEHGTPKTYDLVIGADGLHSRVRALAFGPKNTFTHPMDYAFATFSTDNFLNLDYSGLSHVPRNRDAQQHAVRTAFAQVGWRAQDLLAAMPSATDFYFDELSQITMPTWSTARMTLVGDAGYCASPLSGRGTSQALLGAYVPVGELSTQDTHEQAFADTAEDSPDNVALRDYANLTVR